MKKILALVTALSMLIACTQTEPVVNDEPIVDEPVVIEKDKEHKNLDNFELLGQYIAEVDGETNISLYTSAMRDKKGELMWDDTQEWVLIADTASGSYTLYDERINGRAYMNVYKSYGDNSEETVIGLHIFGNSFNETREYRFSGEGFIETVSYTTDENSTHGISELYNSMPQYE